MRLAFAGTPEFAQQALERLHQAGFEIALVLTQPDRPAGRGMKLQASPVKQYALTHAMPTAQPRSLRLDGKYPDDAAAAQQALLAARPDAMVVAAYGLILPQWVLDLPRLGCLNIHASLLPRWRGAAPIHRAIEAGDAQTGVTIMQMDAGLDTGDMLLMQALDIAPQDTTASLHDKLAELGGELIVQALQQLGSLEKKPQPAEGQTYAAKIDKAEAALDWREPAAVLERRIRAFAPAPGASAAIEGVTLKLWRANVKSGAQPDVRPDVPSSAKPPPGTVLGVSAEGVDVATGDGVLRLLSLQKPGGKPLQAGEFLRGFAIAAGQRFEPKAGA
jgi:methionyl-tRNA formyltransferase